MTCPDNQQRPRKNEGDQVEIRAQTIAYQTDGNVLETKTCDFELRKVGETNGITDPGDPEVHVELDVGISANQATFAIKAIIAQIESVGLPQTTLVVSRQCAQMLEKVRNATEVIDETLPKLPADIRNYVVECLNTRFGMTFDKGGE